MENFVHFTGKLHHRGMKFVRAFTCTGYEHSKVDHLVCYITDNFRMSAVQNETLTGRLRSPSSDAIALANNTPSQC